jgi:hypothetical protein
MIIYIQRLWNNKYIDLKDYDVKRMIKKKEEARIIYNGKRMTLSPQELKTKKLVINPKPIESKYNLGQTYYLYSYLWNPDKELTPDEKLERDAKAGLFG